MLGLGLNIRGMGARGVAAAPLLPPDVGINRFLNRGSAGNRITLWGDSTTQVANAMWALINDEFTKPGGIWGDCTVTNLGLNGQTQAGAITGFSELVATTPNLVVANFGINDARLGGVDATELALRVHTARTMIATQMPGCDVILVTPNSLLLTDVGGLGYVVPNSSAQAYTDVMWNAYNSLVGDYTRTVHIDKQAVFGRTCVASSALMDDQLHPSNDGQRAYLTQLIAQINFPVAPINLTSSAAAMVANPTAPWLVYPRVLEDTRYFTLHRRILITNYTDLDPNVLLYFGTPFNQTNIVPSDFDSGIIWTPNGVYELTGFEGKTNIGSDGVNMYNGVTKAAFPPNTPALKNARLYRRV